MTNRIGNFVYTGGSDNLENNEEYTVYETDNGFEMFLEGEGEPDITYNSGTFNSSIRPNLNRVEHTPMR